MAKTSKPEISKTEAPRPEEAKIELKECSNCRHWKQIGQTHYGKCTALPPQIIVPVTKENLTEHGPLGMFSITTLHTSCGSHKAL